MVCKLKVEEYTAAIETAAKAVLAATQLNEDATNIAFKAILNHELSDLWDRRAEEERVAIGE